MATPRPRQRLSWVPFLVYLVSFLLVISFILFEVLDIDGSDFPANPDAAGHSIRLSETEAVHDLRRLLPGGNPGGEAAATPFVVLSGGEPDPWGTPHSVHQALPDRIERRFRPVLPRASLGGSAHLLVLPRSPSSAGRPVNQTPTAPLGRVPPRLVTLWSGELDTTSP